MPDGGNFLVVDNLRVEIPLAVDSIHPVRGVGFSLEKGEALGIVGESGCGKSLTSLAVMGLLPKRAIRTADRLELDGLDLLSLSDKQLASQIRGNRISMIFQEPMTALNPVYTIGRQLTQVMRLHREVSQAEATERAVYLLERVGITAAASRLSQYPHQFSGGQRQRIMIAMALMNEPELIIADEPTTALDVTIQAQILLLLSELQRELGMTMILITHDLGVVARTTDKIAVMYGGEIVESGTTAQVFGSPKHPYTHGLLECIPDPTRVEPGTHLGAIPGIVPSLIGEIRGCAFAGRCDYAQDRCRTAEVPVQSEDGRHIRCIFEHGVEDARPSTASPGNGDASQGMTAEIPTQTATPDGVPLLAMDDVRCTFDVRRGIFRQKQELRAVDGVSLDLFKGEVLALVGESGCGKTTLARILLGLQPTSGGVVRLDGEPMADTGPRDIARRIQPIFQDPYSSLNPRKTIGQTIGRPLDIHEVGDPKDRQAMVEEIMGLVGLPRRMYHSYPNQVSGGQRQRVAIARAIIMKPEVVICDEPTSALDVSVQSQILNLLLDLRDELGLTYLLITHDLSVVQHMATRVAVMYLGKIVEMGDAQTVFNAPKHPYTKALLKSVLSLTPGAGIPDTHIGASFPNPLDIPPGCSFHPRCPVAVDRCKTDPPAGIDTDGGFVRCHLFDEPVSGMPAKEEIVAEIG